MADVEVRDQELVADVEVYDPVLDLDEESHMFGLRVA